jgi:hypothetical protein
LFRHWNIFRQHTQRGKFKGIEFEELPQLEECFKLNIEVCGYDVDEALTPVVRSEKKVYRHIMAVVF